MTREHDLLRAITDAPDDDPPRHVYADWLEETGDPRAADAIRAQLALARGERDLATWARCANRLHASIDRATLDRLARARAQVTYRRGLPWRLRADPSHPTTDPAQLGALAQAFPTVEQVHIEAPDPPLELMAAHWPALAGVALTADYENPPHPDELRLPAPITGVVADAHQAAWLRQPALRWAELDRLTTSSPALDASGAPGLERLRLLSWPRQGLPPVAWPTALADLTLDTPLSAPLLGEVAALPALRQLWLRDVAPAEVALLDALAGAPLRWLRLDVQGNVDDLDSLPAILAALPDLEGLSIASADWPWLAAPTLTACLEAFRPRRLCCPLASLVDAIRALGYERLSMLRAYTIRGRAPADDDALRALLELPLTYLELPSQPTDDALRWLLEHPTLHVLALPSAYRVAARDDLHVMATNGLVGLDGLRVPLRDDD